MPIKRILTSKVYNRYLSTKPSPLSPRYVGLSDDEFVSVYAYTTEASRFSYADINSQLRGRNLTIRHLTLIKYISAAINVIVKDESRPVYYRYTELTKDQITALYTVGNVAEHSFFTSVSGTNQNVIGTKCNVLLRIEPAAYIITPAYIDEISHFRGEDEFLYPRNTYFEVMQVAQVGVDQYEIFLKEYSL